MFFKGDRSNRREGDYPWETLVCLSEKSVNLREMYQRTMGEDERSFGSDVSVEIHNSPTECFLLNKDN